MNMFLLNLKLVKHIQLWSAKESFLATSWIDIYFFGWLWLDASHSSSEINAQEIADMEA